jgi:hypothetical protein
VAISWHAALQNSTKMPRKSPIPHAPQNTRRQQGRRRESGVLCPVPGDRIEVSTTCNADMDKASRPSPLARFTRFTDPLDSRLVRLIDVPPPHRLRFEHFRAEAGAPSARSPACPGGLISWPRPALKAARSCTQVYYAMSKSQGATSPHLRTDMTLVPMRRRSPGPRRNTSVRTQSVSASLAEDIASSSAPAGSRAATRTPN